RLRRKVRGLHPSGGAIRKLDLRLLPLATQDLHAIAALEGGNPIALAAGGAADSDDQLLDDVQRLPGMHAGGDQSQGQREDEQGGNRGARSARSCARRGHAASSPGARMPCWRKSARTSGRRPRNSTKASRASRLPPRLRMESRKRCAVRRSNTPFSSNAAKASAASTSTHL